MPGNAGSKFLLNQIHFKFMITLFQNITEELTELEKRTIVPLFIQWLQKTDENNRITAKKFSNAFRIVGYTSVSEVRIRKMVNYIRCLNLVHPKVLIGASNGYFLTSRLIIIDKEIESLQGRVDSQVAVIDALKAQRENLKRISE
jgi:hypothetical protein